MLDKKLLTEILDDNLKNREVLLSRLHETNAFSEKDDIEFNAKTDKIKNLKDEIENKDFVDKNDYLVLAADFDNYRKRVLNNEAKAAENSKINLLKIFLKTYDDLEKAVEIIKTENKSDDPIAKGIQLAFDSFSQKLEAVRCHKIECKIGDKFDVNCMDAIAARDFKDNEDFKSNDIIEIYQSGWKLNSQYADVIIRPVKVVVGK